MFEIYNSTNKIPEYRYLKMNEILVNFHNKMQFNTELTEEGYNHWVNMILNDPNYNIVLYIVDNEIVAFICFCYSNIGLWLSEIQIIDEYQKKGLTKVLISKMLELADKTKFNNILGSIATKNIHSQEVFTHIGMRYNEGKKYYEISYDDLLNWVEG